MPNTRRTADTPCWNELKRAFPVEYNQLELQCTLESLRDTTREAAAAHQLRKEFLAEKKLKDLGHSFTQPGRISSTYNNYNANYNAPVIHGDNATIGVRQDSGAVFGEGTTVSGSVSIGSTMNHFLQEALRQQAQQAAPRPELLAEDTKPAAEESTPASAPGNATPPLSHTAQDGTWIAFDQNGRRVYWNILTNVLTLDTPPREYVLAPSFADIDSFDGAAAVANSAEASTSDTIQSPWWGSIHHGSMIHPNLWVPSAFPSDLPLDTILLRCRKQLERVGRAHLKLQESHRAYMLSELANKLEGCVPPELTVRLRQLVSELGDNAHDQDENLVVRLRHVGVDQPDAVILPMALPQLWQLFRYCMAHLALAPLSSNGAWEIPPKVQKCTESDGSVTRLVPPLLRLFHPYPPANHCGSASNLSSPSQGLPPVPEDHQVDVTEKAPTPEQSNDNNRHRQRSSQSSGNRGKKRRRRSNSRSRSNSSHASSISAQSQSSGGRDGRSVNGLGGAAPSSEGRGDDRGNQRGGGFSRERGGQLFGEDFHSTRGQRDQRPPQRGDRSYGYYGPQDDDDDDDERRYQDTRHDERRYQEPRHDGSHRY